MMMDDAYFEYGIKLLFRHLLSLIFQVTVWPCNQISVDNVSVDRRNQLPVERENVSADDQSAVTRFLHYLALWLDLTKRFPIVWDDAVELTIMKENENGGKAGVWVFTEDWEAVQSNQPLFMRLKCKTKAVRLSEK